MPTAELLSMLRRSACKGETLTTRSPTSMQSRLFRRGSLWLGMLCVLTLLALALAVTIAQGGVTTIVPGKLSVGYVEEKPVSYLDGDALSVGDGDISTQI